MKNNKGSAKIAIIIIIVIIIVGGLYLYFNNRNSYNQSNSENQAGAQESWQNSSDTQVTVSPITNDQGLVSATQELNNADFSQFDSGLNANASDSQSF